MPLRSGCRTRWPVHPRECANPRCDNGDRRRLPDGALRAAALKVVERAPAGRDCRTLTRSALAATSQTNIKRVLAYSTAVSSAMFLGVGVGAYGAGLFHLYTHSRGILFLGAGVVIRLHNEETMQRMGGSEHGLKRLAAMIVGAAALAGLPPFAGFWSRDGYSSQRFTQRMDRRSWE
ncbi:MAG: proton-conducting transporter membrane subunit [Chloroflexia bacterium]